MKSNKDYSHLLDRIRKLNASIIVSMSPEVIAKLTDGFTESLVREMLYTERTNDEQRRIIRAVKSAYKNWKKDIDQYWGDPPLFPETYPEYLEDLQTDIECEIVVTHPKAGKSIGQLFNSSTKNNKAQDGDDKDKLISLLRETIYQLKADFEQYKQDHSITQEQFDEIFPDPSKQDKSEIKGDNLQPNLPVEQKTTEDNVPFCANEELKNELEKYKTLYDAAESRLKRYETILGTEEELSKEEKFSIAERIIFCSALLGCSLSEDDIIQQQMAKMIMRFSGDTWQSIRTTISKMNSKQKALIDVAKNAMKENDAGARMAVWRREGKKLQGITNAALNVYYYLHSAVNGGTVGAKPHQCRQAMENIDHAYYLSERKLISKTYLQPQGDEFALPPDEI